MTNDADFDRIFSTLPPLTPQTPQAPQTPQTGQVPQGFGEALPARRELRQRKPPRQSGGKSIGAIVTILVLVLSGSGVWLVWNEYGERVVNFFAEEEIADFEGSGAEPAIDIVVAPGDIGETVARKLAEAGVTASFEAVYSILLVDTTIIFQPGTYRLLTGMSGESAIAALRDPANRVEVTFTIPEGKTLEQAIEIMATAADLEVSDFADPVADPAAYGIDSPTGTLEGYLFPSTYTFEPGVTASEIVDRLVQEMRSRLEANGVAPEDWHEVLTMAGLIQREARFEQDFYKVSRVFTNRLEVGMPLQSDATVTYWTGLYDGAGTSDADRADEENPYNTYVISGLPPGPISLPGELAIDAAVNPVEGRWLYFVSVDLRTGETVFSETYAEHNRARDQWLEWCRASEENSAYC
jgi:UPF0755 protein